MDLVDTVYDQAGLVWDIGGRLKLDLLDDEPSMLASQLLEGELWTDRAAVYRAIAEHAVVQAATVLHWRAEPREPALIMQLLSSPDTLRAAVSQSMPKNDPAAMRWLTELDKPTRTTEEAFQSFGARLATLLDSPAGRSLGTGPESIKLNDVLASKARLLIRLDPRYGMVSRKIGAWALVAMLRLAAELRQGRWNQQCLFIIDEPRLLGHEGRHLVDLMGTARDAGIGLVVADQGVAGLSVIHPDLPDAMLRLTGWQLVFRQGSPADAEKMSELFGMEWKRDTSRYSDGRVMTRQVQRRRVEPTWLMGLPTAHGWLRSAPIGVDAQEIVSQIVVAAPKPPSRTVRKALPAPGPAIPPVANDKPDDTSVEGVSPDLRAVRLEQAKKNVRRLMLEPEEPDGCRHWRGTFDEEGRPQAWWGVRYQDTHRVVLKWRVPDLPRSWDVHHSCWNHWCVQEKHFVELPRSEHHRIHAEHDRQLVNGPRSEDLEIRAVPSAEGSVEGVEQLGLEPLTIQERRAQARILKQEGKSLRQIAEALGVSRESARRYVEGVTAVPTE